MIIAVEGLTNSGKSSLCQYLNQSKFGFFVNNLLQDDIIYKEVSNITHPIENAPLLDRNTELLLYSTVLSRKVRLIKEFLSHSEQNIILDRYCLSLYVYSVAVLGYSHIFVKNLVAEIIGCYTPDITIILESSFEQASLRSKTSPFSRKDTNLEKTYVLQQSLLLSGVAEFSSAYKVFTNDTDVNHLYVAVTDYLNSLM